MATHSSVLAWRIPGTGEPGGLPSLGLHRVGHHWSKLAAATPPMGFPGGLDGKESACNAGNPGSIPGSGRSLREGNGYPLECSSLENSMDKEAWWATVHRVEKSWTRLSNFHFTFNTTYNETWCDGVPNKGTTVIHEILAKKTQFKFNQDDTSGKFTWRDILQNNWPVLFQSVKITKDKERLRKELIQIRRKHERWIQGLILD